MNFILFLAPLVYSPKKYFSVNSTVASLIGYFRTINNIEWRELALKSFGTHLFYLFLRAHVRFSDDFSFFLYLPFLFSLAHLMLFSWVPCVFAPVSMYFTHTTFIFHTFRKMLRYTHTHNFTTCVYCIGMSDRRTQKFGCFPGG